MLHQRLVRKRAGTDAARKHRYKINNKFAYKLVSLLPASIVDSKLKKDLSG